MKQLVDMVLNLLDESTGFWMTDNHEINTDNTMIWRTEDTLEIVDCDNDIEVHIGFNDIIGITFSNFQDMIISVLKLKNRPDVLIHNFIN